MQYRLSCECGRELIVSEGSAGASVACACGASVKVPSLGALRSQGPAQQATEAPIRKEPSFGRFLLLLVGLMVFGFSCLTGLLGTATGGGPLTASAYLFAQGGQIWLLILIDRECPTVALFYALVIPFFFFFFCFFFTNRW